MSAAAARRRAAASRHEALYPVIFAFDSDFGRCVGVDLQAALAADSAALLALLHPAESELCRGFRGARLVEFVGGRVAARLARGDAGPTLRGPGGMPLADGISVSISHTRRLAASLTSPDAGASIGIDVEPVGADGPEALLAERILSGEECDAEAKSDSLQLLRRLSLKEAAYKAVFPRLGHVPLREISVPGAREPGSMFRIVAGRHVHVGARSVDLHGHILSLARVG